MQDRSFFLRYKFHHVLFWILLAGAWYFFRYEDFSSNTLAFWMVMVKVIDLALLVYATNYLLIPQLLYRKRYILFGIFYLVSIISFSLLKMFVEAQLMHRPGLFDLGNNLKARIYDNIIPHFLLVSTGAAFKIMMDYAKAQRRIGELAKEKAETELSFLKSQINPHFLFNSLNAVYFLIDKQNSEARQALHTFSDMLRYQVYECNVEKIALEKEIRYLQDYVDLQRLRHSEHTVIEFTLSGNMQGFHIEPMLLIPFVENSFKHISHFTNGDPNIIKIEMSGKDRQFQFSIINTSEGRPVNSLEKAGGIGLRNVQRRLELLYPGKHKLSVQEAAGRFEVNLTMTIDPYHEDH